MTLREKRPCRSSTGRKRSARAPPGRTREQGTHQVTLRRRQAAEQAGQGARPPTLHGSARKRHPRVRSLEDADQAEAAVPEQRRTIRSVQSPGRAKHLAMWRVMRNEGRQRVRASPDPRLSLPRLGVFHDLSRREAGRAAAGAQGRILAVSGHGADAHKCIRHGSSGARAAVWTVGTVRRDSGLRRPRPRRCEVQGRGLADRVMEVVSLREHGGSPVFSSRGWERDDTAA